MFLGKRPRPGVRFYVFLFVALCMAYPLWQTYRAVASISFPQKEQYAVVVQCINPMLEECDMIIKAVRNHEKFYIPNHSVRESHEKRECFNQPNYSGCSWLMDGDELPKENPDGEENNVISYLPDELMEAYEQSNRRPDFWFIYERGMGLNAGSSITLSRSSRPDGRGVVSSLSGGFTFDVLTNHLTDDGAERIVDSIVSGMNASHFGVIHRAVCAQFSKPELTPAQKGYSEWPLEYPHCGGLPRSVRSIEGNKFCLTWEKPEEEVYVKACKPQFAWLKNWTVTVTDFKWKDPGPRLSTYKARQMVVQENFRFGAAAGIEYFEIIGLDKEFIENYPKTPGYYTPDVTMGDLTTWEKSDEGWLSSAVYKHYGTGHEGLARFLIERDGDLCIHYNVASVEEVPARPCDHRKDF